MEGGGSPAMDQLAATLGKNVDAIVLDTLIAAAAEGEDEVISAIGTLIDETLEPDVRWQRAFVGRGQYSYAHLS